MTTVTNTSARRFRFSENAPATGGLRRRFTQPRAVLVIEEPVTADGLLAERSSAESPQQLDIILIPDRDPGKIGERSRSWLEGGDEPTPIFTVTTEAGKIRFRGGRAVIQAPADRLEDMIDAVVEFEFLDAELRRLETALLPIQTAAPADVPFAYRIRQSDQPQWDRLGAVMEELARLRLAFARLEPLMGTANRTLPITARRAMAGLLGKTAALDRLEAFSDRLEACEDLYEGAVDRITDFRWYRRGNLLEIAIVLLLLAETALLLGEHFRR